MSVCTTVTIDAPEPDVSSLEVTDIVATVLAGGDVFVGVIVRNIIESGGGETVTGTVEVTAPGFSEVFTVTLGPGDGVEEQLTVTGLPVGTHDICANVV